MQKYRESIRYVTVVAEGSGGGGGGEGGAPPPIKLYSGCALLIIMSSIHYG